MKELTPDETVGTSFTEMIYAGVESGSDISPFSSVTGAELDEE